MYPLSLSENVWRAGCSCVIIKKQPDRGGKTFAAIVGRYKKRDF